MSGEEDSKAITNCKRPPREKSKPLRLKDSEVELGEIDYDMSSLVLVKCSQLGKEFRVKLQDLSKEDGSSFNNSDFIKGSSLILMYKKKPYDVQFLKFETKDVSSRRKLKNEGNDKLLKAAKVDAENSHAGPEVDIDNESGSESNTIQSLDDYRPPKKKICQPTYLDNEDKDLLLSVTTKIDTMATAINKLQQLIEQQAATGGSPSAVKEEGAQYNGINLNNIPSHDAYSYALRLLDVFFTKEEQAGCLLFASKKSQKPPLDRERVEQMLRSVRKRYGETWDLRALTIKINQKCRDAREKCIDLTKESSEHEV